MSADLAAPELNAVSPEPRDRRARGGARNPEFASADQPTATASRKLPPTERDFEIYEAVHVCNCSTWSQARKHQISQTRVRQVIRRVVEWLGEVLPPQAKVAREQEVHLARQIAADRFQRQLEEATTFWNQTREMKYAGLRIRLTTAQARLGVVGGLIDGLAADAIEGIPVPVWQPPAEADREHVAPPEPAANRLMPPAGYRPGRRRSTEMPVELHNPLSFDDITPEIVEARAAWGCPLSAGLIEQARKEGRAWPRADALSSPPVEDFSALGQIPPTSPPPSTALEFESHDDTSAYDENAAYDKTAAETQCAPSQGLLTTRSPMPVSAVQVGPDEPGATISQTAPSPPGQRFATADRCPSEPQTLEPITAVATSEELFDHGPVIDGGDGPAGVVGEMNVRIDTQDAKDGVVNVAGLHGAVLRSIAKPIG
jgi:hypothetical protein